MIHIHIGIYYTHTHLIVYTYINYDTHTHLIVYTYIKNDTHKHLMVYTEKARQDRGSRNQDAYPMHRAAYQVPYSKMDILQQDKR